MEKSANEIQNISGTAPARVASAEAGKLSKGNMESGRNAEHRAYQDNNSGQTRIPRYDCPLSKSTRKLLNRVVPNGTLRGVEGEGQISPIRLCHSKKKSDTA